ncbi:MAG: hypothetical protein V3T86_00270 [Planctomycetota bacterium]
MMRHSTAFLIAISVLSLLSVAAGSDEITFDVDGAALVIRSPISKHNFMLRAPASFERVGDAEAPWLFHLRANEDGKFASVKLRKSALTMGEAGRDLGDLARARAAKYKEHYKSPTKPKVEGADEERTVSFRGFVGEVEQGRTVVLIRNGVDLYEFFLDSTPPGTELELRARTVVDRFSVIDVKEALKPQKADKPDPAALQPKKLEAEFHRIKLLKPRGFLEEQFQPRDGLIYLFRGRDPQENSCIIRVRVFLARSWKKNNDLEKRAQKMFEQFSKDHKSAKGSKRLKRRRSFGADLGLEYKLTGRHPKGNVVVAEERRFLDHDNGRLYDIQVKTFGGAGRHFKNELKAFWRSIQLTPK